jgi:hypothetical protein
VCGGLFLVWRDSLGVTWLIWGVAWFIGCGMAIWVLGCCVAHFGFGVAHWGVTLFIRGVALLIGHGVAHWVWRACLCCKVGSRFKSRPAPEKRTLVHSQCGVTPIYQKKGKILQFFYRMPECAREPKIFPVYTVPRSQFTAYKSLKNRGWSPAIFTQKTINQSIPQSRRHGTITCWEEKIVKSAYLLLCVCT